MDSFVSIIKQLGPWTAGFCVFIYFGVKHFWPWWKAQRDKEQEFQHGLFNRMQQVTEVAIKEMTHNLHANNELTKRVGEHLETLTDEIRSRH